MTAPTRTSSSDLPSESSVAATTLVGRLGGGSPLVDRVERRGGERAAQRKRRPRAGAGRRSATPPIRPVVPPRPRRRPSAPRPARSRSPNSPTPSTSSTAAWRTRGTSCPAATPSRSSTAPLATPSTPRAAPQSRRPWSPWAACPEANPKQSRWIRVPRMSTCPRTTTTQCRSSMDRRVTRSACLVAREPRPPRRQGPGRALSGCSRRCARSTWPMATRTPSR